MKIWKVIALAACILLPWSGAQGKVLGEAGIVSNGIGGAGGLFSPSISPFNPDLMLCGSDMGGVYRSTDGGKNWVMINGDEIQSVAASNAPVFFKDRIYWYSSVYSPKVSFDEGRTWKSVKWPWKPRRKIVGMTAYRKDAEILFIATEQDLWRLDVSSGSWDMVLEGAALPPAVVGDKILAVSANRLMESADRGKSWTPIRGSGLTGGNVLDIAGGSGDGKTLVLASVENRGIARSEDQGKSWEFVARYENQQMLQIPEGQVDVAWAAEKKTDRGLGKRLWRSDDGGRSWDEAFHFSGFRKNVEYSWVQTEMKWGFFITKTGFYASKTDPRTAVVTTQGDMYLTRDGGDSWHSLINRKKGTLPDGKTPRYESSGLEVTTCYQYLFDPWEPNRHYVAFTDIGFIRSLDKGETWSHGAKGSPWTNTFYRVRFDPDVPGRMYAAASNRHDIPNWSQLARWNPNYNTGGIVVSQDYGATWKQLGTGFPVLPCTDIIVARSKASGKKLLYATAYGKGLFVSRDGGETWTETTNNMNGRNQNFLRLWQSPKTGSLYCLVTAFRDMGNVMVPGALWRSDDDGASWTNLTEGTPLTWPTSFEVDTADENVIYMSVASIPGKRPQQGGIWKTVDGGKNWERVLRDFDLGSWRYDRMMAVRIHPTHRNIVYGGCMREGLWYSRDAGETWKQYKAYPFHSAQGFDFDPADDSKVYVTTFGGGIFIIPYLPQNN